jgi:septal ring factor EnvC (AmiA/AmiB activator)
MKSSQEPFQERDSNLPANQVASEQVPEALTFEQELEAVERSLHSLRDRSLQVQQDQQLETQLQERQEQIKDELKNIQNRLDELEVNLESRLFSWGSLKEPFWQIVRFGGLGVVLGWFLAFAVIQSPKPTPQSSIPASQSSQP